MRMQPRSPVEMQSFQKEVYPWGGGGGGKYEV